MRCIISMVFIQFIGSGGGREEGFCWVGVERCEFWQ